MHLEIYLKSTFCLCILPVLKQYLLHWSINWIRIFQSNPNFITHCPLRYLKVILQVYFQTRKSWYIKHFLWNWSSASATEPHWWSTLLQLMAWCRQEKLLPEPMLTFLCCHMMSQWVNAIDQSHRCRHHQAACREPAGSYDKTTRTAICFEHKTQYLLIHALYTPIVVFWQISNIPPMIGQSQMSCNTPTFCIATILVKYCYTTGSWLF